MYQLVLLVDYSSATYSSVLLANEHEMENECVGVVRPFLHRPQQSLLQGADRTTVIELECPIEPYHEI